MPANSRVTQGPQNKDKADTTLGTSSRTVRPRGPGSQEHSRQENEVSARAEVGTGWVGGVAFRDQMPSSPGRSDLVSGQTHLRVLWLVQGLLISSRGSEKGARLGPCLGLQRLAT